MSRSSASISSSNAQHPPTASLQPFYTQKESYATTGSISGSLPSSTTVVESTALTLRPDVIAISAVVLLAACILSVRYIFVNQRKKARKLQREQGTRLLLANVPISCRKGYLDPEETALYPDPELHDVNTSSDSPTATRWKLWIFMLATKPKKLKLGQLRPPQEFVLGQEESGPTLKDSERLWATSPRLVSPLDDDDMFPTSYENSGFFENKTRTGREVVMS